MKTLNKKPFGIGALAERWDWAMVIILTPIVLLLTSLVLNGIVDYYDEGLHYLAYPLFKAGKIPYLDFYPLFPPIWTYSNIILEAVFGQYLIVQRLWFVLQASFVVWACYAVSRRFYRRRIAAISIIAVIIIFGLHSFWVPRWSGARLAVYIGFLLLYMRHVKRTETGASARLFTLGLMTGLANLYALDVGIHITAVSAAMVVITFFGTTRSGIRKPALKFTAALAGFMLPLLLWAAYLAYHGALHGYVTTYYYVYMFQLMPISTKILSASDMNLGNLRFIMLAIFLILLSAGLLYGCIYKGFIKKGLSGKWRVLIMAMLLSSAVSVSTIRALDGPQYQMFALIPMLLWGGFTADRLASFLSKRTSPDKKRRAGTLITIIIIAGLALPSYFMTTTETSTKILATRVNFTIARLLYEGDEGFNASFSTAPQLAGIGDNHLDTLIQYLHSHTSPDEAILAFPMSVGMIPALAGRHSATSYPIAILVMGSPELQLEYIKEIEREKPHYAVFYPAVSFGGRAPIRPYFRPVYHYIIRHYRPAKDFPQGGAQQIWVRRDRYR